MYTPHPINKQLDCGVTNFEHNTHRVFLRDFARLKQINDILKKHFLLFKPDIAPIFARGAIPMNFALMRRLEKGNHYQYLDGKVFHLFPGVNKNWIGLHQKPSVFFENEMKAILPTLPNPTRIFITDSYYSGTSINAIFRRLQKLAQLTKRDFVISLHAIVDAEKAAKATHGNRIQGPNGIKLNICLPRGLSTIPRRGDKIGRITVHDWKYHCVNHLFFENIDDFLGAGVVDSYYEAKRMTGTILFINNSGNECGGSVGADELNKRLVSALAEDGPHNRKSDFKTAKTTGQDFLTRIGMDWKQVMEIFR